MIGNYGIPSEEEVDEHGVSVHFESAKIHVGALLIDDLTADYRYYHGTSATPQLTLRAATMPRSCPSRTG